MCAEAIIEINLANASQRWVEVPVPICKVRVGGPPWISTTPFNEEFSFINPSGEWINEGMSKTRRSSPANASQGEGVRQGPILQMRVSTCAPGQVSTELSR
ncbi:hypothetical protein BDM02DRAFT_1758168 [Thelephora ganbajun]|uniref:Uncharacterized protein n=1 Tax=Thelephora ganbajun TaxID=370292 RepID=A0ACB6Z032_THEGA|nr:hypothetical protein BDM02DRAFT_1758168 [Thelephora ganbajun]